MMSDTNSFFAEQYRKKSAFELARLTADADNLVPEARDALRAEIARRPQPAVQATNSGQTLDPMAAPVSSEDNLDGVRGWLFFYGLNMILASVRSIFDVVEMNTNGSVPLGIALLERAQLMQQTPAETREKNKQSWQQVYAEIEAAIDLDPASEAAQALTKRWVKLAETAHGGNEAVRAGGIEAWKDRHNWPPQQQEWLLAGFGLHPQDVWIRSPASSSARLATKSAPVSAASASSMSHDPELPSPL